MIVYFSGTGNSRYCADFLAYHLEDQAVDAGQYLKQGIQAELLSGKPWIFVSPTYAWQLPRIFADFIRESWIQGSKEAYFVMTCGSEIGGAAKYNQELCRQKNLNYRGTLEVPMPENYIALFSAPDRESSEKIIKAAQPILEDGCARIQRGEAFPEKKASAVDRVKSGPINKGFYTCYISAEKFFATSQCIGCGKCEKACVLNNIRIENNRPVWGKNCTHCMACICGCPLEAIEYGNISRGKRRYLCPAYKE